jgi:hypothetical protein
VEYSAFVAELPVQVPQSVSGKDEARRSITFIAETPFRMMVLAQYVDLRPVAGTSLKSVGGRV